MPTHRREKNRDDRDYDTTQLHEAGHGKTLSRDFSAHFWRWSFARRFIGPKDNVLEVGCGEDRPLSKILTGGAAPHVNTYVGIDLNRLKESNSQRLKFLGEFNFVERWKELPRLAPEAVRLGKAWPGFDVVVHYEVLEHMHSKHQLPFLKGCHALLRPGGSMLMSTPAYDGVRHAANHIAEVSVIDLQKMIEKAGFKVDRRFGTFFDIKHLKKGSGLDPVMINAVRDVSSALGEYFDNDAISNIFGPLFPDYSRNCLWVCRKTS